MVHVESVATAFSESDQVVYLEVHVNDLDNANERLNAYYVTLDAPAFSEGGLRFVPYLGVLPPAAHPNVFGGAAGVRLDSFGTTDPNAWLREYCRGRGGGRHPEPQRAVPGAGPDSRRAPASAECPRLLSGRRERLREELLGAGAPITDAAGPPGGIVITPEPASGALLIALTIPLLRRRR